VSKKRLFLISVALTAGVLLAVMYAERPVPPKLDLLADGVYLSSQLGARDYRFLYSLNIKTVVDLRPDGEAADQIPSSEMEHRFALGEIAFHYIPVAHESISDQAVEALSDVLAHGAKPMVLYCRTGRRAIRTYALAEASRTEGPGNDEILKLVSKHGFSATDIKADIAERVARRGGNHTEKN
jgi:uncharacterized protein (TIGR01244 family)